MCEDRLEKSEEKSEEGWAPALELCPESGRMFLCLFVQDVVTKELSCECSRYLVLI